MENITVTDTGVPQGDCASANEFTFYLAKALLSDNQAYEHDYAKNIEIPIISKIQTKKHIEINQEYADDISQITSNRETILQRKLNLPLHLKKWDLTINDTKTEEYDISRANCDNAWKKCKLLGSLLDTECDIKRRKGLAVDAAKKFKYIFRNKKLTIKIKIRAFDTYVTSIFLYNSEIWTITDTCEKRIDSFHRRLLRSYVLNTKWPKVIKNEDVYKITNTEQWSSVIKKRRMRWFGHVVRMPENTPVQKALTYAQERYNRPRGKPKATWLSLMKKQLAEEYNLSWEGACLVAQDRVSWRNYTK